MPLNRRNWLKLTTSGALFSTGGVLALPRRLRIRLVAITDLERRAVSRIVDLLIPADATPGALDLGIDREILAELEASRWNARWVAEAMLWLDEQAGAESAESFVALEAERQMALLQRMESAPERSAPARVFAMLRYAAMSAYYGRPEAWPSLGFDGPPQPAGFPGYASPPAAREA